MTTIRERQIEMDAYDKGYTAGRDDEMAMRQRAYNDGYDDGCCDIAATHAQQIRDLEARVIAAYTEGRRDGFEEGYEAGCETADLALRDELDPLVSQLEVKVKKACDLLAQLTAELADEYDRGYEAAMEKVYLADLSDFSEGDLPDYIDPYGDT